VHFAETALFVSAADGSADNNPSQTIFEALLLLEEDMQRRQLIAAAVTVAVSGVSLARSGNGTTLRDTPSYTCVQISRARPRQPAAQSSCALSRPAL
jgi:hypothetical protein